jgi:CheY-like chemotaxis protein
MLPSCLHLEDEPLTAKVVATRLSGVLDVVSVRTVAEALAAMKQSRQPFQALVVDIEIPNSSMSGADFIRIVRGVTKEPLAQEPQFVRHRAVPIVVVTGAPTPALQAAAVTWKVSAVLAKPLNFGALQRALLEAIGHPGV